MNLAVTCLLTSIENPMCRGCQNYKPEASMLAAWLSSLRDCEAVVLHDELPTDEQQKLALVSRVAVWFVRVTPTDENLFFQRWRFWHQQLIDNTTIDYVFITDGSDVRMLNEPWPHMRPGTLYVGSEEDVVSNKWIVDNHPSMQDLAKRARHKPLLNAGLVGGDRGTVVEFIQMLIDRFASSTEDLTDMAAFNLTLYEDWTGWTETGVPVHTKFGAWVKSSPQCWWAHK